MAKRNIIKQTYNIEITVDVENVVKLYPNYRSWFGSPQEFIEFIVANIENNIVVKDGMKKWGYSAKIERIMSKDKALAQN